MFGTECLPELREEVISEPKVVGINRRSCVEFGHILRIHDDPVVKQN